MNRHPDNPRLLHRRQVVQALPLLAAFASLGGLTRMLSGCVIEHPDALKGRRGAAARQAAPTDGDEYVPADETMKPIVTRPVSLPNAAWEARAKQLEGEQARLYGAVFTKDPAGNGPMAGKERSHVPLVTFVPDATGKRVNVLVAHVMGKNGQPDAGTDASDASDPSDASADAAADAPDAETDAAVAPEGTTKPPEHYISTIYVRAEVDGQSMVVGLWEFTSDSPAPASVTFALPEDVSSVTAFEWCTFHGLWKSDVIPT